MNLPKTALITGSSSGIGKELAKCFAKEGYNLVLVGRSLEALKQVALDIETEFHIKVLFFAIDISLPHAAETLIEELKRKDLIIDALVNNAGVGLWGDFEKYTLGEIDELIYLHLRTSLVLARYCLTDMLKKNSGYVLNVGSVFSYMPVPYQSIYAASKAFLLSFTLSLREELLNKNIQVSILCPGTTETAFREREGIQDHYGKWLSMSAEKVATAGFNGLMQGKAIIVPGMMNKLYIFISKIMPLTWVSQINDWLIYRIRGLNFQK